MRVLKALPVLLILILFLTACDGTEINLNQDPADLAATQAEAAAANQPAPENSPAAEQMSDAMAGANQVDPTATETATATETTIATLTPTVTETPQPTPPGEIPLTLSLPNCYEISYLGTMDHEDGSSTWRYEVMEEACAQDLSNWMLELPVCATIMEAAPEPWEFVSPDPNFQLEGIKWETGTDFMAGEFTVRLAGDLISGTVWAGAIGPDMAVGWIAGPICISDTMTATPTAMASMTMTPDVTSTPTPTEMEDMDTIYISDNDQTFTFTCYENEILITGNNNTITLEGSCSSITVRGNDNTVYWEMGNPVILDYGNGNMIVQQ